MDHKPWHHTGMPTDTLEKNSLGNYLRECRARLDPAEFGFSSSRRRTPGLRREEVAQRADVSATWYTWLEQGRGGVPSAEALEGIATALALNAVEREHLFLLAQHRPPQPRYQASEGVSPALQRFLDSLEASPALVRTPRWDIIAWNAAAAAVLTDYGKLPPAERNVLRLIFLDPGAKVRLPDWDVEARFVVASLWTDSARAGACESIRPLVAELSERSPDFRTMWEGHEVRNLSEGVKRLHHPIAGPLALAYHAFAVEGQPGLGMIVYTPATPEDRERVRSLVSAYPG